MTPPKEQNNFPVTDPKEMEMSNLPNKEFKIVLRKLNELQENTERQFNEIHKQHKFNTEVEIIKKNQREILEQKTTMYEMKNVIQSIKSRLRDFPGGAVVGSPPANAGDMGLSPGPGGSHMLQCD